MMNYFNDELIDWTDFLGIFYKLVNNIISRNISSTSAYKIQLFNSGFMKYRQFGSGPTLICIPGSTGNHEFFLPLIDFLGENFQVISCDHPNTSLDDYLAKLDQLVKEHDAVGLIGASVGGFIVQNYMDKYEAKINGIVLSNSYNEPFSFQKSMKWTMRLVRILPWFAIKWFLTREITRENKKYPNHDEFIKRIEKSLNSISKSEFIQRLNWTMKAKHSIQDLEVPILQIISKDDPVIEQDQVEQLHAVHNNVKQFIIGGGSHFPYYFEPESVSQIIIEFYSDLLE